MGARRWCLSITTRQIRLHLFHVPQCDLMGLKGGLIWCILAASIMISKSRPTVRVLLFIIVFVMLAKTAMASPLLGPRSTQPFCVNQTPPDSDLLGLGVRIGVYLQIAALMLAVCCGKSDTLSAIPAALMTALTLNIVLSMKASTNVFGSNPVVQDFWVTQCQLYLLVTILPYMFLFGHWHHRILGVTKCALLLLATVYTYAQTFWFWTSGYKNSDEVVCGVAETMLFGRYSLFTDHGRYAIFVIYAFGILIMLIMLPNFIRGRPGYLSPLIGMISSKLESVKAVALGLVCIPWAAIVLAAIEGTVRRGTQGEWVSITGQWLALGVGFCTAAEAAWHGLRSIYRELSGGSFHEEDDQKGDKKWIPLPQRQQSKDMTSMAPEGLLPDD